MAGLLVVAKRQRLAEAGMVTLADFEVAWRLAWRQMNREHAWPHATIERRGWKVALESCRAEFAACFLGWPTPFQVWSTAILEGMSRVPDEDGAVHGRAVA